MIGNYPSLSWGRENGGEGGRGSKRGSWHVRIGGLAQFDVAANECVLIEDSEASSNCRKRKARRKGGELIAYWSGPKCLPIEFRRMTAKIWSSLSLPIAMTRR